PGSEATPNTVDLCIARGADQSVTQLDPNFDLSARLAVVAGGASGIGAAISQAYRDRGARVVIFDRDELAAKKQAGQLGSDSVGLFCDVSDPDSVSTAVDAAFEECGRIDILVNCAGIVALDPAELLSLAAWRQTIDVNLTGTF